ncbi:MAG: alkaline phosphatase family protein [Christensenellales bacterium]|jgi:arylsulfatase A-like enzyme
MRLLLISLDSAFCEDAETLLNLPHLGALAGRGVFCDHVQTIYPTLTYPVHTSLITGCYPGQHGILHNELHMPELPSGHRPWYWDASDIQVETLHTAAARAGREVASILWPVTGHHRGIKYNFPEVLALPGENQVLKVLRYGSAWWLLKDELRYGRTRPSTQQPHLDRYAALVTRKLMERQYYPGKHRGRYGDVEASPKLKSRHMPDMMTLHLTDLDTQRHRYGTHSPEAGAAMVRLDQLVGGLLETLEKHQVLHDTVVAVVSDHGQEDITETFALDQWLQANQVPARAQTLGLGAYIHCERGQWRNVAALLHQHKDDLRIQHVYERPELQAMGMGEHLELAVEAAQGVEIVDTVDDRPHRATHGFGLGHKGAQCLLWLAGPGIRTGVRLERARLVDIAPTLAHAVGLHLPQAQGSVMTEVFTAPVRPEDV